MLERSHYSGIKGEILRHVVPQNDKRAVSTINWNLSALSLPLFIEGKQTASQSAGTADRVSASRWDAGANRPNRQVRLGGRDSHTQKVA